LASRPYRRGIERAERRMSNPSAFTFLTETLAMDGHRVTLRKLFWQLAEDGR
jgi:hypothetical protein